MLVAEPMIGARSSCLYTVARGAGQEAGGELSRARSSMKIDELREKTGVDAASKKRERKATR